MSQSLPDDEEARNAAADRMITKIRRLMIISGLTTMVAIAAVIGVIGYRVFKAGESAAPPSDVTERLPKGSRIVGTAVADDRIVVTVEGAGGRLEIRTFDLRTLRPTGRLQFAAEP